MTARAKGLRDKMVRRRHAVPNALLPTHHADLPQRRLHRLRRRSRSRPSSAGPGSGELTYEAIRGPDIPLLQALFLLFSVAVIASNVIADVVVAAVDPRIRGMTDATAGAELRVAPGRIAWARRRAVVVTRLARSSASSAAGIVGLVVLAFFVVVALLAPLLWPAVGPRRHRGDRPAARAAVLGLPARHRRARALGAHAGASGAHGSRSSSASPRPSISMVIGTLVGIASGHYTGWIGARAGTAHRLVPGHPVPAAGRSCWPPILGPLAAERHHRHRHHVMARARRDSSGPRRCRSRPARTSSERGRSAAATGTRCADTSCPTSCRWCSPTRR